ncbi:VOC family protein [Truepera radiovictrix]|nr:VOC family protein [Truepera radiovictrix]WMT57345.1 VOC family protein [Truepera radiovictrix]
MPEGSVLTVPFQLAGQDFLALNGGPQFKFTPATSFFVTLGSEREVDALWKGLSEGGGVLMPLQRYDWSDRYGWLHDRYGLTWQLSLGEAEQTIVPSLLFVGEQHGKAEAALRRYVEVFEEVFGDSRLEGVLHYGPGEEAPGTVKHAQFRLAGHTFTAMDSGLDHGFTFTEAVSFIVHCETQAEIDALWERLSAHPEAEGCGWLKDAFGVSWQVVPAALPEWLADRERSERVMAAMLPMKKLDIGVLERA